jgi:hypothetical protein
MDGHPRQNPAYRPAKGKPCDLQGFPIFGLQPAEGAAITRASREPLGSIAEWRKMNVELDGHRLVVRNLAPSVFGGP